MELNDVAIKSAVRDFQENLTAEFRQTALENFRRLTELYIYNFPRLAYRRSPDECSEFYLYLIERLEGFIQNYPIDAPIRFKTWFNYALRNQFLNFIKTRNMEEPAQISIEEYEDSLMVESFSEAENGGREIAEGLAKLPESDRLIVKLYYLPETITAEEVAVSAKAFQMTIAGILTIQKNLICAYYNSIHRLREIAGKLTELNRTLVKLKYRMMKEVSSDLEAENEMALKIARLENSKFKMIREMEAKDDTAFEEFVKLFRNLRKARYCLSNAKKRLRFEILKNRRNAEEKTQ